MDHRWTPSLGIEDGFKIFKCDLLKRLFFFHRRALMCGQPQFDLGGAKGKM